jgi:hypothetical protein
MSPRNARRRLFQHLLLALGISGASVGLLAWSHIEVEATRQAQRQQTERIQRISAQLVTWEQNKTAIAHDLAALQRIPQQAADENSTASEAASLLSHLQQELKLPAMHYRFQAGAPISGKTNNPLQLYNSPLHLDLGLIHEGDLLRLLDTLPRQANALLMPRHCRLWQGETTPLRATCQLDWIFLRRPAS